MKQDIYSKSASSKGYRPFVQSELPGKHMQIDKTKPKKYKKEKSIVEQ